jgi:hypothetical protein
MMAVDFSTLLYLQAQNQFGRWVTITPIVSNPGAPAYPLRGIYDSGPVDIETDFGTVMISDQTTILDIRDNEVWAIGQVLPQQGDRINIPAEGAIPAEGDFEVTDVDRNAGGETTLTIRKWEP